MRTRAKLALAAVVLASIGGFAGLWLTTPARLSAAEVAAIPPGDATRGQRIFFAGGCASCHAADGAREEQVFELPGGLSLETQFGGFVAPNISPHPTDGIGTWSLEDFANAMMRGVSPRGEHYYPAFPYGSYARMAPADVSDLFAFMKTLPPVEGKAGDHRLGFPFTIRRGLGLWKQLYIDDQPVVALASDAPEQLKLGRYLVEGPGHCGECHTPRGMTGGLDKSRWLAGAVAAEGDGVVPNITSGEGGIDWSEAEIAEFLASGFTPEFDTAGGSMAAVIRNTSKLRPEDRAAMAAYLTAVPPQPNGH